MEEWKDIDGYEGLYQVSNLGNIRNSKGKILPIRHTYDGYCYVRLSKNGKRKYPKVSRLVAIAFLPNPSNLPQVNHKDENKDNNCTNNLEWCTCKYNCNYGTRNKRMAKAQSKAVIGIKEDTGLIVEFDSMSEACRQMGIAIGNMSKCCKDDNKTLKGFNWRYLYE